MFVTIINDCRDGNAMNRQASRAASYFAAPVFPLGVTDFGHEGNGELEAAGNLIDTLDATGGTDGVVLVNVAVRHGKGKKWPNGTPFGYFNYKKTLVIATLDGYCLSLVKKFGLTDIIQAFDIPTVIDAMIKQGHHSEEFRRLIVDSQFRSYEFIPRAAKWLKDGIDVPTDAYPIANIPDAPKCIWWVDNFGNTVTTLLADDINHKAGQKIKTKFGEIMCYERLKDVPNDEPGLIIGSSGMENRRFVSLVIQGKSAAKHFNIKTGDLIFDETPEH